MIIVDEETGIFDRGYGKHQVRGRKSGPAIRLFPCHEIIGISTSSITLHQTDT